VRRTAMVATAAILLALPACSGDEPDEAPVVLHLASIDEINDNTQSYGPQAFLDDLARLSGGKLTATVDESFGDGATGAESSLVKAIASGQVDGGWPATRAFAAGGLDGLQAVEAPLLITGYEAEKALVTGPAATEVLARLDGTGVVGLGLAAGPLRRPFAADEPLVAAADWKGVRFRVFESKVQADAVTALGGTPVNVGLEWTEQVDSGGLRGAEFDIPQYAHNQLAPTVGKATGNVVLWPKVFVLSLSRQRYDALTEEQRGWVRDAASAAVTASVSGSHDEAGLVRSLCGTGVTFAQATPAQLAELQDRVRPVLQGLAGPVLDAVRAVAIAHPAVDTASCG
jgi:TRAP-type C4-dicarboxylate transport system substrate-binding protein